jgi:putative nucleotidyltransferase with HDIG domain
MESITMTPPAESPVDRVAGRLLSKLAAGQVGLPILPAAAQRIIALAQDDSTSVRDIVEVLKRDQSLTSYVLKVANSPICTPSSPIVSIHQACTRLGSRQVRDLALMVTISSRTFVVRGYEKLLTDMFKHAVCTAYFAQEIARQKRLNVEEAFLSGLLHDVGKPAALPLAAAENLLARSDVIEVVDRVHVRYGVALVERWGLPDAVAKATSFHHSSGYVDTGVQIVQVADHLAHVVLDGAPQDSVRSHAAAAALNLYPEDLDALFELSDEAERVAGAFA